MFSPEQIIKLYGCVPTRFLFRESLNKILFVHRLSCRAGLPLPTFFLQAPQSARREDEGEAPERAERPECPDEEEAPGGLGDLAVMCPPHGDDWHACRDQPDEQHDH